MTATWGPEVPWVAPANVSGLIDEFSPVHVAPGLPSELSGASARVARCPVCAAALLTEFRVGGRRDVMYLDKHLGALRDGSFAATRQAPKMSVAMNPRPIGPKVRTLPVNVHCWTRTCGDRAIRIDEPL